jgi:hypothetical protein
MTFDANAIFEAELAKRGVSFEREDESAYSVHVGTWRVTASLDNVRRNAERDQDPDAIIRFMDHVLGFSPTDLPWNDARTLLLWSAEPTTTDFGDAIRFDVSDEVARVLTLTDSGSTKVTWVTPATCDRWGVSIDDACSAAATNQDRLLDGIGNVERGRSSQHTRHDSSRFPVQGIHHIRHRVQATCRARTRVASSCRSTVQGLRLCHRGRIAFGR